MSGYETNVFLTGSSSSGSGAGGTGVTVDKVQELINAYCFENKFISSDEPLNADGQNSLLVSSGPVGLKAKRSRIESVEGDGIYFFKHDAKKRLKFPEVDRAVEGSILALGCEAADPLDPCGPVGGKIVFAPDPQIKLASLKDRLELAELTLSGQIGSRTYSVNGEIKSKASLTAEIGDRTGKTTSLTQDVTALQIAVASGSGGGGQNTTYATDAELLAEITRAQAAENVISNGLAAEISRAQAAEQKLQGYIGNRAEATTNLTQDVAAVTVRADVAITAIGDRTGKQVSLTTELAAEVSRAQTAEGTLTSNLTSETERAQAAESKLTSDLAVEVSRAQTAEGTLTSNLTGETKRAQAAESELAWVINNTTTTMIGDRAGKSTTLTQDVTSLQNSVSTLSGANGGPASTNDLNAEITRATAAEGTLTTNLNAEISRATAAETKLRTDLTAETTRATAAETALSEELGNLSSQLTAEVGRAQTAEGNLLTNYTNLSTQVANAPTGGHITIFTSTLGLSNGGFGVQTNSGSTFVPINTNTAAATGTGGGATPSNPNPQQYVKKVTQTPTKFRYRIGSTYDAKTGTTTYYETQGFGIDYIGTKRIIARCSVMVQLQACNTQHYYMAPLVNDALTGTDGADPTLREVINRPAVSGEGISLVSTTLLDLSPNYWVTIGLRNGSTSSVVNVRTAYMCLEEVYCFP